MSDGLHILTRVRTRQRPPAGAMHGAPFEVLAPGWLRTTRLLLRPLGLSDRKAFLRAVRLTRADLDAHHPLHLQEETDEQLFLRQVRMAAQGESQGTSWRRAAFLEDGRLAGCFNLGAITRGLDFSAHASWWVSADCRGLGLACEGVQAMLDLALDPAPRGLGLLSVSASIAEGHHASRTIACRAGMRRTSERIYLSVRGVQTPHDVFVRTVEAFTGC
ncbi:MAG: N-acetyltransferase [Leptolyngbya sp. PLA1]|nr:N-acetyltransferase [Leptolyngbya sp. PLA1]